MIERLSSRCAFNQLHADGARSGRGPVRLVKRSDPTSPPRFAFAIPRSVGNAVERNRIRRRIRAILTDLVVSNPRQVEGGDHLIRVTASIDHWSHDTLHTVMTELLAPVVALGEAE
ncbi:MAG: ribonuclease P protein component [Acidimicrobiales bacterium]|nr:ribonuclease P protein component [Acidimicrobiales bacterium]MDG2219179.1 ribonuclease P protein component [Acidimicrobiales bacterium]